MGIIIRAIIAVFAFSLLSACYYVLIDMVDKRQYHQAATGAAMTTILAALLCRLLGL